MFTGFVFSWAHEKDEAFMRCSDGLPILPKAMWIPADGDRAVYFWDVFKPINETLLVDSHQSYPYADGDTFWRPESLTGWRTEGLGDMRGFSAGVFRGRHWAHVRL
jgi:hypothetical protein